MNMNYAIFGNGTLGKWVRNAIDKNAPDCKLICIADNNSDLLGIESDGTPVVSAKELSTMYKKREIDTIIVAAQVNWLYLNPLLKQLNSLGIAEVSILPQYYYDYLGDSINIADSLIAIPTEKPCINGNLNIVLNRHCNLNCQGCGMFANLYNEPCFSDFNQYKKDLLRLKELFSQARYIGLFGGEPLLNKELPDYIKLCRELFPAASIYVETNGILLLSCEDSLFETMRDNNVCILITPYVISKNNEIAIKERCNQFNVCYDYRGDNVDDLDFRSSFYKALDSNGKHTDIVEAYNKCINRGSRYNWHIYNGYMSGCLYPLYVNKYNETFGETFKVEPSDTINIHNKDLDGWTLADYLLSPKPFCKYCAYREERKFFNWSRTTTAKASDWLVNEEN